MPNKEKMEELRADFPRGTGLYIETARPGAESWRTAENPAVPRDCGVAVERRGRALHVTLTGGGYSVVDGWRFATRVLEAFGRDGRVKVAPKLMGDGAAVFLVLASDAPEDLAEAARKAAEEF